MCGVCTMRRTNVYLDDRQRDLLRLLGERRGLPVAALVREAVDAFFESQGVRRIEQDERKRRFDALMAERRRVADELGLTEEQVERDVFEAIREVREARAARRFDTNVWVSGLALPASLAGAVLRAVRDERLTAVASWELADEIAEVLRKPKSTRLGIREEQVIEALILLSPFLPDVDVDISLRDPDDAPVVNAAGAGNADAIVTGDRDLLEDRELRSWLRERGIEMLTPAELFDALG